MSQCSYCKEKVGFFSGDHKECRERAEGAIRLGTARIEQAIADNLPSAETITFLKKLREEAHLNRDQSVDSLWLRAADSAAMERSKQAPISSEAHEEIANIFVYLKPDFLSQGEGLIKWSGYISLDHSNTIYQVLHGQTPYMPPDVQSGFILARDENLILKRGAQLAEYRSRSHGGTYQSVSIPVGGGMYYRIGATTPRISEAGLEIVDQGKMALTDQAIYFGGSYSTFRIGYEDILRLEPYKNAFEIHEKYGSGKVIVPANLGFEDGWYFFALISAFIDRVRE